MRFSGKQLMGLMITGAAAGAAIALMYAPKTGVQMRKDVRRFGRKTADRLDNLQEDIREQMDCALGAAKKVVIDGRHRLEKILA
jgi:gas vesicle protein